MNKKSNYRLIKALLTGFFLSLALPASAVESKDPIKLTIHDWTGQYLTHGGSGTGQHGGSGTTYLEDTQGGGDPDAAHKRLIVDNSGYSESHRYISFKNLSSTN